MQTGQQDAALSYGLEGAPNFRDMGGYETLTGGVVRRGRLYRSESLARLTDADLAAIERLDIELVCDLRGASERKKYPSRWPSALCTEWMLLDIDVDLRAGNVDLREALVHDPTSEGARQMMLATYRIFPAAMAAGMGRLFRALAGLDGAALIHCTAGKDRTGFMGACLLRLLDVPGDVVEQDYMLTAERIDIDAAVASHRELLTELLGFEPSRGLLTALFGVSPEYLREAFATIDEAYGSFDRYLSEAVGVDDGLRRALLSRFTC